MLSAIGTIKIDNWWRYEAVKKALWSLGEFPRYFDVRLNIIGRYAKDAAREIERVAGHAAITHDAQTPTYFLKREQMGEIDPDDPVFLFQEDHWYVAPIEEYLPYLLNEFIATGCSVLTVTHLLTSWERKELLPVVIDTPLYQVRLVSPKTQAVLWEKYPHSYVTGVPAIYSWGIAHDILEFKKEHLSQTTMPDFELGPSDNAAEFLRIGDFHEMIPTHHVFQEIISPGLRAKGKQAMSRAIEKEHAERLIHTRRRRGKDAHNIYNPQTI